MTRDASSWWLGFSAVVACCGGCTLTTPLDDLQDSAGGGGGFEAASTGATSGSRGEVGGFESVSSSATSGSGGGAALSCPPIDAQPTDGLVMNEIAPDGAPKDWIEIENRGPVAISLCGFLLTEDYDGATVPVDPSKVYAFGDVIVAPGGFVVLVEKDEISGEGNFPFGVSKVVSERITFFDALGAVIDDQQIPASELPFDQAHSWGRVPDGSGGWKKLAPPTPGAAN